MRLLTRKGSVRSGMRKHRGVFSLETSPRTPKSWLVLLPPRAVPSHLLLPHVLPRVVLLRPLLPHLLAPLCRLPSELSSTSVQKSRPGLELESRVPVLK